MKTDVAQHHSRRYSFDSLDRRRSRDGQSYALDRNDGGARPGAVSAGQVQAQAEEGTAPNENEVAVQILSLNDYHGHLQPPAGGDATLSATQDPTQTRVGGAQYLATWLKQLRQPNSLTVAAGDLIGGTPFLSGLFHDEPSVETLAAMELDVSGVGNHEFDEGLTELLRMQNGGCHPVDGCYFPEKPYPGAPFAWLAANVRNAATGDYVMPPTWVKEVAGVKVGFIGMTLEGTPELVAQAGIRGLRFDDEVASAKIATRALRRPEGEHDRCSAA